MNVEKTTEIYLKKRAVGNRVPVSGTTSPNSGVHGMKFVKATSGRFHLLPPVAARWASFQCMSSLGCKASLENRHLYLKR